MTRYRFTQPKRRNNPFRRGGKFNKGRRFAIRLIDYLVGAAVLFLLLYSLIVNNRPNLKVGNLVYRPLSAYRAFASDQLTSLKNRTKLTLNEAALAAAMKSKFPELSHVSIELPLFSQTILMRLDVSVPSFFFHVGPDTYVLDSQGIVIGPSSEFVNIKNLPRIDDDSGFSIGVGKQVLSSSEVNFIKTVMAQCRRAKVPIASLVLPQRVQELDLKTADRQYIAKFFLGGDSLVQSGQFLAARHDFDQTGNQPAQYLDVRVEGKIYYK